MADLDGIDMSVRDSKGRSYRAPAWSGWLADLDANQLSERADAIGAHIGRCTTRFVVDVTPSLDGSLTGRFKVTIDGAELRHWATRRAEVLNELERRAVVAGCRSLDLVFASPSWQAKVQ